MSGFFYSFTRMSATDELHKKSWLLQQFLEHISENRQAKFKAVINNRSRHITVVLENLFQPHNAAAVLRSCDCFGVQDVHIIENNNTFSPNREIDMGSSKWLSLHRYNSGEENTMECLNSLKKKGYRLIATTPHTDRLIGDLPVDKPFALLFGTEMTGLSEKALEAADEQVKLPMYGFTESYNISVSVALALFNTTERMRNLPDLNWQLKESDKIDILLTWAKNTVKNSQTVEKVLSRKYDSL